MKLTNVLVFATAASAAAVQSQRIHLDISKDIGADFLEGMRLDIPQRVNIDIPQKVDTNTPQKVDTNIPQKVDINTPQKVDINTPQKVDTDILKKVDTILEAAVIALNQRNQSLNGEFFQSRFSPLLKFVEHESAKIVASRGDLSMDDAHRLFKPAENLPRLAVDLYSALDGEDVKATIIQNKACSIVQGSTCSLQAALNFLSMKVGYVFPEIKRNTGYKSLASFTDSLAETCAMFRDC
ncbi:hypothetical protein RJ55_05656 [Drechmeria coniospora]|nr:hypothetical protein RJ55_05656 [Drechmeria coniospora]